MRVSQNPLDILWGNLPYLSFVRGPRTSGAFHETAFSFEPHISVVCCVLIANARWPRRHCRRANSATCVSVKGLLQGHYVLQQYSNRDLSRDSGGDSES